MVPLSDPLRSETICSRALASGNYFYDVGWRRAGGRRDFLLPLAAVLNRQLRPLA